MKMKQISDSTIKITIQLEDLEAVSYTHLDVYKRQVGVSRRLMERRKVDFPLPELPMMEITSPFSTVSEISFKTSF